mgnify:CR=1 FL=1
MISDGNEPNAVKISFGVVLTSANSEVNGFRRDSADLTCLNFNREYATSITDCNWVLPRGPQTSAPPLQHSIIIA